MSAKNPQLEDGFIRIANELFEAVIGFGFSQRQLTVLLAILRKTYGYGKKEDDMSASQIGKLCNIDRANVTRVLGQLASMQVITKRQGSFGMVVGINKNYREWVGEDASTSVNLALVPNQHSVTETLAEVVSIQHTPSVTVTQVGSVKLTHTKDNLPKDNQQKKARTRNSRPDVCFAEWMETVRAEGKKPIPEDHSVFAYADKIGLPIYYVRLCWMEFKRTFAENQKKKYADWPGAFSNYVRKNYFRLWFEKDGQWLLTTAGVQLQKEMKGEQ